MNFYFHFFIFLIILFFYIHIVHQYKRSEDLEIYELEYSSNTNLQEVCDVKQPILFEYKSIIPEFFENFTYDHLLDQEYSSYDVRVKETADYYMENSTDISIDYAILPYSSASSLMKSDPKSAYFSENNEEFLEESGLVKKMQLNDSYLKPSFTIHTKYDIMIGSCGAITPLRYHTNYRYFLCVNSGKIRVKMTPWKTSKYLYPLKDFENFEFYSPINVWKPQYKYRHETDKIKFLEFDVMEGYMISIPPYWWYSIEYDSQKDTLVCGFTYNSVMNIISNAPLWVKYYIQQNNIKKRIAKVIKEIDENENNNENDDVDNNVDNNNASIKLV